MLAHSIRHTLKIMDIMKEKFSYFGLRADSRKPKRGDFLPPSRIWYNGRPVHKEVMTSKPEKIKKLVEEGWIIADTMEFTKGSEKKIIKRLVNYREWDYDFGPLANLITFDQEDSFFVKGLAVYKAFQKSLSYKGGYIILIGSNKIFDCFEEDEGAMAKGRCLHVWRADPLRNESRKLHRGTMQSADLLRYLQLKF